MTESEAIEAVLNALKAAGIRHAVVGSLASNTFGIVRTTQDADLLISATADQLADARRRLPPGLEWDPQTYWETITGKLYHVIRLHDPVFQIELFEADPDGFDQKQLARSAVRETTYGTHRLCTADDVVIQKLRWFNLAKRSKDEQDLKAVIAVQQSRLDWPYIHRWCDEHGTRATLDRVCAELGVEQR